MLCERLLTVVTLGSLLMNYMYVHGVTLSRFSFPFKQKNASKPLRWIYLANFSEYTSFKRTRFKLMEIWGPKLAKEM